MADRRGAANDVKQDSIYAVLNFPGGQEERRKSYNKANSIQLNWGLTELGNKEHLSSILYYYELKKEVIIVCCVIYSYQVLVTKAGQ